MAPAMIPITNTVPGVLAISEIAPPNEPSENKKEICTYVIILISIETERSRKNSSQI